MTCPVCGNEHKGFIEYFIQESPYTLGRISRFYDIPEDVLRYHRDVCMKTPVAQLV